MELQGTQSGYSPCVIKEKDTIKEEHTAYLTADKPVSAASMHPRSGEYLVYICMLLTCVCR